MPKKCCKAHIWRTGIFFSDETYSWDEVKRGARKVREIKYMADWWPWNTIYRVTTSSGEQETYATYESKAIRNYRAWYKRNRQLGLCVRCSRPVEKGCMCNACKRQHNENEKRRNRAKRDEK